MRNYTVFPNGGKAIETYGVGFPPYTHGRVKCLGCGTVTAQCGCPEGCKIVGTVNQCTNCGDAGGKNDGHTSDLQ